MVNVFFICQKNLKSSEKWLIFQFFFIDKGGKSISYAFHALSLRESFIGCVYFSAYVADPRGILCHFSLLPVMPATEFHSPGS